MAADPILQKAIADLGQSQDERLPTELGVHFADVDERTPSDLLEYARALARDVVPFFELQDTPPEVTPVPQGWQEFFAAAPVGADTRASLALYDAFLRMYDQGPRKALNRLTGRHLDFFYRRVLGFVAAPAVPDRAHALVSLKKGSPAVLVRPAHLLSAGKDEAGVEQIYAPTGETVVNTSEVATLRSVYVDRSVHGHPRFAAIANSADGLGGQLPEDDVRWRPFGHEGLPIADVGFSVASPVLRMREGHRTITLSLKVEHADAVSATGLTHALQAFLTSDKQWIGPYGVTTTVSAAGLIELRVEVPDGEPAITDYDVKTHAHSYATTAPVLQLLLQPGQAVGYDELSRLRVNHARISVDVAGITTLTLESDSGALDPTKAFLPFGPHADAGSRFLVGCDEALSKSLSRLDLTLEWKSAPRSFAAQYAHYAAGFDVTPGAFTVQAAFRDRASEHSSSEALFDSADATRPFVMRLISTAADPAPVTGSYVYALSLARTAWGRRTAGQMVLRHPTTTSFLQRPPERRRGFVELSLQRGFLHHEYREQSVARIVARVRNPDTPLLKEPYTPTLQRLSLAYTAATTEVGVSSTSSQDFAQLDVQFFHVGPFGQMRDHGHQRAQLAFLADTGVPLLSPYGHRGELLIGLSGLGTGDSVSVLFQVAEGSANPDVAAARPEWFVLCDNYWRPLGMDGVARDTTNRLLTTGVITFVIPADATTENTIMPAGLIWLRATTADPASASQLLDVAANAVEVRWVMDSEDAASAHLSSALPPRSIARLSTPIAQVAKVRQPYASFGGRAREGGEALRTRASERLRHKNRAVSPWDYERLVLDAFPEVHRAKCIPHARPGSWMSPGHVLVVVVPDLRNRHPPDPLRPRVDADTVARITDFLRGLTSGHASVFVANPAYQRIRVACRVRLHAGFEFNFYRRKTIDDLVRALSPWAFDPKPSLTFGRVVYASALLNFIEELPFVDYVTDFALLTGSGDDLSRVERAEPATPDAILVSDATHDIGEAL